MKAVLVVDVEEYGDYYADVYRKDADDRFEGRYYLKPMPEEEESADEVVELGSYNEGYGNGYECGYADGWNACLKKIIGETE